MSNESPESSPVTDFGYYPPAGGISGAAAWRPGVIPLRPLSLNDIFNGAVEYARANPKPTLGLTTVVVFTTTVLGFVLGLATSSSSGYGNIRLGVEAAIGAAATVLAVTLLSGMLTVIVARSVLGSSITAAQAWERVRGRLPALLGLAVLMIAMAGALVAAVVVAIIAVARATDGTLAAMVGIPLAVLLIATLAYLGTRLSLAPIAIVLERKNIPDAIRRSVALCRPRSWRVLGILLLAGIVAGFVASTVSVPFVLAGRMVSLGSEGESPTVIGDALSSTGQAFGAIMAAPFLAGVLTLLYVDARFRSEAFDFTLLGRPANAVDVDGLWLGR